MGGAAELYVYNGGTSGSKVELYKVIGGGHTWPGSGVVLTGGTCMDFNAAVEIWLFFRQYNLSGMSTNTHEITAQIELLISPYPNPTHDKFTLNVYDVPIQIKIINSLGQIINITNAANKTKIDFTINDKGIYFLQLTTAKGTAVGKIVIGN